LQTETFPVRRQGGGWRNKVDVDCSFFF